MTELPTLAITPLLVTFIMAVILTPLSMIVIKKVGLVDDPKLHKHPGIIHTKPIPRGGGIPLFLSCLFAGLLFLPHTPRVIALFSASFLALVIGLIDDKLNAKSKDVSPYLRFAVNIITAIIVVASGVSIKFITNPLGGILHLDLLLFTIPFLNWHLFLSDILSVIWLVWIMNMLNWSKGVDGQMPGIVAISAIIIGILSLRLINPTGGDFLDATLSFIIAGSALGFLLFNFYPAKIFPGYGATSLYLLLGVASILSSAKLATALLVMGVPLVDFIFTILRRLFNKQSPFKGDNKHLHHLLLRLGLSQRQTALFYWLVSAILGIIALSLESRSKIFAIIMVGVITGGGLLFLHAITKNTNDKITS
ncbi:MAG TPA: MraY family glycosyltransferase [Methylomirabilota bacterium]|nr:MraY family glycosyltransferase [Methylomirabilota bacterium]